jgi:shikimate 5-dehydrogenase
MSESANGEAISHRLSAIGYQPSAISGHTRLVGVIGWPVSHSRSPRMHNAAYAALGLDWAYVPLPVAPERVGDAVRGLGALGFAGANVTVPHKHAVIPFLDELTPIARAIGAVNTIVIRPDGSLLGDSTDGAGFMADLWAHDVLVGEGQRIETEKRTTPEDPEYTLSPRPRVPASPCPRVPVSPCPRVLVLGAGGAARSVVYALAEAGATVAVVNRTLDKAQEICQTIGAALEFTAESAEAMKTSAFSAVKTWHGGGKGDRLSISRRRRRSSARPSTRRARKRHTTAYGRSSATPPGSDAPASTIGNVPLRW